MSRFPEVFLAAVLFALPAAAKEVGRPALPEEIAAWNIDVRPDGKGLPPGRGTAKQGEAIFQERCAACHGEFGEGLGRWPELAGGQGSLTGERPFKTIGSFWPYASSVFDYIRRAMPFGNPQSLTPDEVYAVVAYVLSLNDVITDEGFELDAQTLPGIRLPNAAGFFDDDREVSERAFWAGAACMHDCKAEVHITGRASVLDVTPDAKSPPKME
jgi:cytochrome c